MPNFRSFKDFVGEAKVKVYHIRKFQEDKWWVGSGPDDDDRAWVRFASDANRYDTHEEAAALAAKIEKAQGIDTEVLSRMEDAIDEESVPPPGTFGRLDGVGVHPKVGQKVSLAGDRYKYAKRMPNVWTVVSVSSGEACVSNDADPEGKEVCVLFKNIRLVESVNEQSDAVKALEARVLKVLVDEQGFEEDRDFELSISGETVLVEPSRADQDDLYTALLNGGLDASAKGRGVIKVVESVNEGGPRKALHPKVKAYADNARHAEGEGPGRVFNQVSAEKDPKDGETIYEFSDGRDTVKFKMHPTREWTWVILAGDRKLANKIIDAWSKNMMDRHLKGSPAAKAGWMPGSPVTINEGVVPPVDDGTPKHLAAMESRRRKLAEDYAKDPTPELLKQLNDVERALGHKGLNVTRPLEESVRFCDRGEAGINEGASDGLLRIQKEVVSILNKEDGPNSYRLKKFKESWSDAMARIDSNERFYSGPELMRFIEDVLSDYVLSDGAAEALAAKYLKESVDEGMAVRRSSVTNVDAVMDTLDMMGERPDRSTARYLVFGKNGSNKFHVFVKCKSGWFNGYGRMGYDPRTFGPMTQTEVDKKIAAKLAKGYTVSSVRIHEAADANGAVPNVVLTALRLQAQAKVLHWQTQSYAEHMAFGGFYDAVDPLVDKLVEALQGKRGKILLGGSASVALADHSTASVSAFLADAESFFAPGAFSDPEIDNIVEEVKAEIDKLKYLLTLK